MSGVETIHTGGSVMAIEAPVLSCNAEGAEDWIETFESKFVQYVRLNEPTNFNIEDIAHSLSNLCRFNGHCKHFYSVAQHCCIVAEHMRRPFKLTALMHDAAEAYIGDIPRPIKGMFPGLKNLENHLQAQIFANFGLPFPYPRDIDIIDSRLLLAEGHQLFKKPVHWTVGKLEPLDYKFTMLWSPETAEVKFLQKFEEYSINGNRS